MDSDSASTVTILFADMSGSTSLYDRLGDESAHRTTSECLRRISECTLAAGGSVIKTIGDEVLATFPDAERAIRAAAAMQRAVEGIRTSSGERVQVSVGLHTGSVIRQDGDVFGDAVNLAARMVALANQGEILTTRDTIETLAARQRSRTRMIDRRLVKGKHDEVEIFEVIWQSRELTVVDQHVPHTEIHRVRGALRVQCGEESWRVDLRSPVLRIGRDPENDIVIPDSSASRFHASIELRQEKFVLYDRSTNGTLVFTAAGQEVFLRREELILQGTGRISVGAHTAAAAVSTIDYALDA